MFDDILPYYERELTALRKLSGEFAQRYPKIASRLLIEGDNCEDPHVERMIESFAFLTGRIHKKIDDEFPQITDALLSVLYPHFLRPVPSMSIAQLQPAPNTELTAVQHVPAKTGLLTRPVKGMPVRYRTAYPVDIWPVSIAEAAFEPIERSAFASQGTDTVATVRLRLQPQGQNSFKALGLGRLRLYLDGESPLVHALYELLLNSVSAVSVHGTGGDSALPPLRLGPEAVQPVGFAEDEGLLDYDPRSFLGYRLLQEYFVLPEKFLFVDLVGLDLARFSQPVDIRVHVGAFERAERAARLEQTVDRNSFRLNCTPIVNLFPQQAEPIRLSQEVFEYPVVPDARRPLGLEVYSIDSVRKASRGAQQDDVVEFLPFFSIRHGLQGDPASSFWFAQRRPSTQASDDGSELSISLVDRNMDPRVPAIDTLSLRLTCTNRDLPAQLPFGGDDSVLQLVDGGAIASATLLKKPSATWRAPMRMANQWRLISHLSLNHLSLVENGRDALLEILSLYNFGDSNSLRRQIAGIVAVDSHASSTRVGRAPRQSFVRGTEIDLTFDEDHFVGSGVYLLARVLDIFFGLYCTANSYTRLSAHCRQREQPLVRFPPRSGALPLV
ncbi:type VI secretion system baseplate subunit TssF [Luteimonas sp. BDR2-5]|uniref:type VI secretion system baseplate subunit TssF n=1 Tax=Proluteimonas luteida TaxID=2878685 RepID=UPI001E561084|nr:type VI secretion system baseplate subunit TssF [Luteimonas sp. BDR2-5]MCD9027906.1 type VI secretion system baseplate subunit TssF [Luteimonas sp. BDR2-5]